MYDRILEEIQKIEPGSGASNIKPERQEAFLKSWLNQYSRKPTSPDRDKVARCLALALAKNDVSAAITLLYPHVSVSIIGSITPEAFLSRKFYVEPFSTGIHIHALKHWKKVVQGANETPISALIILYEAAWKEVNAFKGPEWIQIEALGSLKACFDLTLPDASAFILGRKNRLAALMLDPATAGLPHMQVFWERYQQFYGAQKWEASFQTHLTVLPDMGLPEASVEPLDILLPEHPTVDQLVAFKKDKIKQLDDARAKRAWAAVDKTTRHPREQFWRTFYPALKGLYMAQSDSDWPNYGEALLIGDQLINYRKLALMAQHRDVCKLLMGQDPASVVDKVLEQAFVKMPGFRALSFDEQHALAQFNASDELFWHTLNENKFGKNAYQFFERVLVVLDTYRTAHGKNVALENEMSIEGLRDIQPFIVFFHQSHLATLLTERQNKLPREAVGLYAFLTTLAGFRERMMVYRTSCFNDAHIDMRKALDQTKELLINDITFDAPPGYMIWENQRLTADARLPLSQHDAVIRTCLASITDIQVMLAWVIAEAKNRTALPLQLISDRFVELSRTLSATELYNFVLTHIPQDGKILFSDQLGQENGLAFTRHVFLKKLFPMGIEPARLVSILDFTCAMHLHVDYAVTGLNATMMHAIDRLKKTDHYTDPIHFAEVRRLLVLLISHATLEDIKCLVPKISIPAMSTHQSVFYSLFEDDRFDRLLAYMDQVFKYRSSLISKNSAPSTVESLANDARDKAGIILYALRSNEHNAKKLLMTIHYFLPYIHGIEINGRFEVLEDCLSAWCNNAGLNSCDIRKETIILVCLASYESSELRDNRFAESLGFALKIAYHSFGSSALPALIADLDAVAMTEPVLEIDSIDKKMNRFRALFKQMNELVAMNALLKAAPLEIYKDILHGSFKLIEKIKHVDDLITVLYGLDFPQELLKHMENIPGMDRVDNLIKIWPYLNASGVYCVIHAAKRSAHKPTVQDLVVLLKNTTQNHGFLYDTFIAPMTTNEKKKALDSLETDEQAVLIALIVFQIPYICDGLLPEWLNDTQVKMACEVVVTKRSDLLASVPMEISSRWKLGLCQAIVTREPSLMNRVCFSCMRQLPPSPEKNSLYETFIPWAIVHNPGLLYDRERRIPPQFLIDYSALSSELRRKLINIMLPDRLSEMKPYEVADTFLVHGALHATDYRVCLGDYFARFHAIYQLLVNESPGGFLLDHDGMAALGHLDPNNAEGWSAVLRSPDMKEGSLRLLAWNIAIKEHAEEREQAVMCALSSRRNANVFFSQQNTWQPSDELLARIKTASNEMTAYNKNSLSAKMY